MTWHSATAAPDELDRLLARIRHQGGTVARCERCTSGLLITWFTV